MQCTCSLPRLAPLFTTRTVRMPAIALCMMASAFAMSANAAEFSAFSFSNFSAGIGCGDGGSVTSNAPVAREGICTSARSGFEAGSASSSFGHVGARAEAVHSGNFSFPVGWISQAIFSDNIVFTSTDPSATTAEIAVNLAISGHLNEALSASASVVALVQIGPQAFLFSSISGPRGVQRNDFTNVTGSTGGAVIGAGLRSPRVTVLLNGPSFFRLSLTVAAEANSDDRASALADFSNSFELPFGSDVFLLPQGVTANAGEWLVNNRRVAVTPVPEPATWAMFIAGVGLIGQALRRRRTA